MIATPVDQLLKFLHQRIDHASIKVLQPLISQSMVVHSYPSIICKETNLPLCGGCQADPALMGGLNFSNIHSGGKRRIRQPVNSESDQADEKSGDTDSAHRSQRPRTFVSDNQSDGVRRPARE
jgi:hypothetical protein